MLGNTAYYQIYIPIRANLQSHEGRLHADFDLRILHVESRLYRKLYGRNGPHYIKSITSQVEDDNYSDNRILRYRWSTLIKNVYADPLICPDCGGRMKMIAFIKKKTVIASILKHLGLLDELPHAHSPPSTELSECDITYEPVYDDLSLPEQIELSQAKR